MGRDINRLNFSSSSLNTNSNFFTNSKKAISPVVATALLLVVAVVAVVGFQGWFNTFQSGIFTDIEQQGDISSISTGVETIVGDTLYIRTARNLTVTKIEVDGVDCDFNGTVSNMQAIDISACIDSVSTTMPEVVVVTDRGLLTKTVVLRDSSFIGTSILGGICDGLPGEWVEVPSDGYFTTSNFCVMKWEAKALNNATGLVVSSPGNTITGYLPYSSANQTPWVEINQTNARIACDNLNNGVGSYRLMTNSEWMTIARNIATQENNWADGIIGSNYSVGGGLFIGNAGNVPGEPDYSCWHGSTLSGIIPGSNCILDNGYHENRNKRMHILSNDARIWDMSGNVWHWLNDTVGMHTWVEGGNSGYWSTITNESFRLNSGPLNSTWGQYHGVGYVWWNSEPTRVFIRGGFYGFGSLMGLFSKEIVVPSREWETIGFRCTYMP